MKSECSALRAKRIDVIQKSRKVASLEAMVTDFQGMALELTRQISAEEERTGVTDPADIVYSTLAKATTQRRTNLLNSVADIRTKLDTARRELGEAEAELRTLESAETRDPDRHLRNISIVAEARHA
jgi:chromosome segregation ATPase